MLETREVNFWLRDTMREVRSEDTQVKQYGYRTARILHTLVRFPRNEKLESLLANKAGKNPDNHTVYQVTLADGTVFAVFCHDREMSIGLGIREEH